MKCVPVVTLAGGPTDTTSLTAAPGTASVRCCVVLAGMTVKANVPDADSMREIDEALAPTINWVIDARLPTDKLSAKAAGPATFMLPEIDARLATVKLLLM